MQDNEQSQIQPQQPETPPRDESQPEVQSTQPVAAPSKGLAIASMVLGIVALVLFYAWFVAIPLAILALVFGAVYLVKNKAIKGGKGMAITGIILGAVDLFLTLIAIAILMVALPELQSGSRDTARKNDLAIMSSQVAMYQSENRGTLPEVSYIDTKGLTEVMEVFGSGEPTTSVAVYEVGVDCQGTPSEGLYNIKVQLESGDEYCTEN